MGQPGTRRQTACGPAPTASVSFQFCTVSGPFLGLRGPPHSVSASETTLWETTIVGTCHFTFDQTHEVSAHKSEP